MRPTSSLRVIPAAEFVGMERRFIGIEEHVVPLLRCSRRGHPARTHVSQSRRAGEQAPTTFPRDLPHVEAARNSTQRGERRTVHCRQEPADGHRHLGRRSSGLSESGEQGLVHPAGRHRWQTHKHRYNSEEAVLFTMDQLPLPPWRASVNPTLVRDMCPSTK